MEKLEKVSITEMPKSLEERWYPKLEKFGSFQVFKYLEGDEQYRDEQKKKFINGEIENPTLDYPKIDQGKLARDEDGLLGLKKNILEKEGNEVIKKSYRWKINEKIAGLRILKATSARDDKKFSKYSEYVYGKPSLKVFVDTIQSLKKIIEEDKNSDNPQVVKVAEELDKLLAPVSSEAQGIKLPSKDTIDRVRAKILSESRDLLNVIPEVKGKEFNAEEIGDIFQKALGVLQAKGWKVMLVTSSGTSVNVDQETKTVEIPESKKLIFKKLRKLILHETSHVDERVVNEGIKGEKSRLRLLGLGLDRYERGNEGIATMKEQILDDKIDDFSGLTGHLAISLAYGLDGKPRNFRGVYEILEKYFYLKNLKKGKQSKESLALAQNSAWNKAVRTFRGTKCSTHGICFTKDIVYREGNIGVWNAIRKNPDELLRLSIGEYDPANPRHIWILDQPGISDKDLEENE